MVVEIADVNEDELFSNFRCFHCQDVKETRDGRKNATYYYRDVLKELDEYKNHHPIEIDDDWLL
jgi:hypothetical protein